MSFKKQFQELEDNFIKKWGEYIRLHDELDLYRGKKITEENSHVINTLVRQIQELFIEIYPLIIFVTERYSFCKNALNQYTKFIDDIKKAGATEEPNHEIKA